MEGSSNGSGSDIDQRSTNYAMAELTRDALATSAFMQRVRVHQQGGVDDEAALRFRQELNGITRQLAGRKGRVHAGYTISLTGEGLEAELVTRHVAFPEQVWEAALALSPLELRGIDAIEGCDAIDVASRMLRVPLSTRHMSSSEQRAAIERHLRRHGGLWFVYWGKFVTDDRGLPIAGIQAGRRVVSARRVATHEGR